MPSGKVQDGHILYDTMLPSGARTNNETLTANKTLTDADAQIQFLNPGAANRDVVLPVGGDNNHPFYITNTSSATYTLTIKTSGGATVTQLNPGNTAILMPNRTTWKNFGAGIITEASIVLSDVTTNDVSVSKHGFAPKAPNSLTRFLRGDATWAELYRTGLNVVTSPTSVSNTTSETTLYTFSIPGGTLGTNRMLLLRTFMTSTHFNAAGTLRFKYGATTLVTLSFPSTAGVRTYMIDLMLRANGATNAQVALGCIFGSMTAGASGTANEDSTANRNLVMTWQYSAAVAETTTLHGAVLELLPPL